MTPPVPNDDAAAIRAGCGSGCRYPRCESDSVPCDVESLKRALSHQRTTLGTFVEGVEAAAKWHDEQYKICRADVQSARHMEDGAMLLTANRLGNFHQNAAIAIRSLAVQPSQSVEERDTFGAMNDALLVAAARKALRHADTGPLSGPEMAAIEAVCVRLEHIEFAKPAASDPQPSQSGETCARCGGTGMVTPAISGETRGHAEDARRAREAAENPVRCYACGGTGKPFPASDRQPSQSGPEQDDRCDNFPDGGCACATLAEARYCQPSSASDWEGEGTYGLGFTEADFEQAHQWLLREDVNPRGIAVVQSLACVLRASRSAPPKDEREGWALTKATEDLKPEQTALVFEGNDLVGLWLGGYGWKWIEFSRKPDATFLLAAAPKPGTSEGEG